MVGEIIPESRATSPGMHEGSTRSREEIVGRDEVRDVVEA
jgi:hypothetical protein